MRNPSKRFTWDLFRNSTRVCATSFFMTSNNPSFISSEIKLGFLKYPDRGYLMNSSKDFHKNLARDFFVNSFGDSFYDFCKNPFRNFARNSNWNLCRNLDSLIRYYSSIPRIHSGISSRVSSKIKLFHGFFGNFYKILKKPIDLVYFFLERRFLWGAKQFSQRTSFAQTHLWG